MSNIWSIILQTLEVSIVALILIILKKIFLDKLSPKWQYEIWSVLCVRILIPVGILNTYLFPDIIVYLETLKSIVEKSLNSNYILSYEIINVEHIFPFIKDVPYSLTDYIFVVYVLGVFIYLLKYVIQYYKIKTLLNYGYEDNTVNQTINYISNKYDLKPCKTIILEEVHTAFVYGAFHPILVLPNKNVDEKIILHELLHVQNYDCLQSILWSLLSSLHWFNPFMIYVFKLIKNDMESSCDQRVLEKLNGEERRDYGRILLNMCSDSYAYAFGTTSISNGTRHIKTRIEAIVRFKKYPQGMKLVSICIIILLLPFTLGTTSKIELLDQNYLLDTELIRGRLVQCETAAGAIDTFVKGIRDNNQKYIMAVTSEANRRNFDEYYRLLPFQTKHILGEEDVIYHMNEITFYYVLNINEINNGYEAILVLQRKGAYSNATSAYIFDYIPIRIIDENGYKVEVIGNTIVKVFNANDSNLDYPFDLLKDIPYKSFEKNLESGNIKIEFYKISSVIQELSNSNWFVNWEETLSQTPNTRAEFVDSKFIGKAVFTSKMDDATHIGIITAPKFINIENETIYKGDVSSSGSDGIDTIFKTINTLEDHVIRFYITDYHNLDTKLEDYQIRIFKNYNLVEESILEIGE